MQPKVSIIIPFYNVEAYLTECLESVINQDYSNIQVVAVNDGSTDDSLTIMNRYADNQIDWNVISIDNSGQSTARNIGLENADGDYILFLDSDDKILPQTVSQCIDGIIRDQVNIFLFGGQAFFTEDGMKNHSFNYQRQTYRQLSGLEFLEKSLKQNSYIVQPCMYLFKRKDFPKVSFYPGILHEDNLFTTELLVHQNALVSSCSEPFYLRRFRNNSSMTQPKNMNHIVGYKTVIQQLLKLKTSNDSKHVRQAISRFNDNMIENFVITCFIFFKTKVPLNYKKEFIYFYIKNRRFNVKNLVLCLVPEVLFIKKEHQ